MRGKVKFVYRDYYDVNSDPNTGIPLDYPKRITYTNAVLTNGTEVEIDEDEIREVYNRQKITDSLINRLSHALRGKIINYSEDWGDFSLDDDLVNLI